jgi:hypothetical protein
VGRKTLVLVEKRQLIVRNGQALLKRKPSAVEQSAALTIAEELYG